ncbi:MAG: hypothetical protein KZQ99_22170 [Candidatus Thiodiazotropha sp. (ex Dulcina madagascariensis)]|nr:hypothetical protein [Candidatus Thiodiazotropha sp. (ex Dulcina madagascariensis)]
MENEMDLNFRGIVFTFMLLSPIISIAADTVPLPSSDGLWSTVPQMEIGKVKRLSKDKLPPDLRAITEKEIKKTKRGYEEVPEEYFDYLNGYYNHLRSENDALSNLRVNLVDINLTKLAKYQYEGLIPGGPTIQGPWTSVTRVFRRPDSVLIKLTEWDFVADGGAIVIIDEVMNSSVSGIPAFLSVKKSPSGKAITTLEWATDKKQYTLTAEDDDKIRGSRQLNDQKWLLSLADSIAASDSN